eukprot:scaffold1786_cov250-Pinguiococcus_pyrenoidosus.AAC.2
MVARLTRALDPSPLRSPLQVTLATTCSCWRSPATARTAGERHSCPRRMLKCNSVISRTG